MIHQQELQQIVDIHNNDNVVLLIMLLSFLLSTLSTSSLLLVVWCFIQFSGNCFNVYENIHLHLRYSSR